MPLAYQKFIRRADLRMNPEVFYVFGDNMMRKGLKGQAAACRGEPNAIGISTKWRPSFDNDAFYYDHQKDRIFSYAERDFQKVVDLLEQQKLVIWPTDGIGTGLSQLPTKAPLVWAEFEKIRKILDHR